MSRPLTLAYTTFWCSVAFNGLAVLVTGLAAIFSGLVPALIPLAAYAQHVPLNAVLTVGPFFAGWRLLAWLETRPKPQPPAPPQEPEFTYYVTHHEATLYDGTIAYCQLRLPDGRTFYGEHRIPYGQHNLSPFTNHITRLKALQAAGEAGAITPMQYRDYC